MKNVLKGMLAAACAVLLVMGMAGCSDPGSEPDNVPPDVPPDSTLVSGVTLNKTTLSLSAGTNETLTASVTPDNATNKTLNWTSSNPSVATVADGIITAVAAGSSTITVSPVYGANDTVKATCTVTVTAAAEAMSTKTALQYLSDLKMGINLGNTLDAVSIPAAATETAWGNPAATQAWFNGIKESGFDIVRIPVTWFGHIGSAPNYTVSQTRLARVAQVVGYAKNAGLKAIINIHHDGNNTQGNNTTWGFVDMPGAVSNAAKKTEIQNEITKVWTQIAEYFKDYGDYLIFETLNEVHNGNWGSGASAAEQTILFDWNQAALSAIRATGGNNATRYVAVPGLGATEPPIVAAAYNAGKLLPNDPGNGTSRLIVSVHYYDPAQYTVASQTDQAFQLVHTWGTAHEKQELTNNFKLLKSTFFDRGIAVYAGEWGGPTNVRATMSETIKNTHLEYIGLVAKAAAENDVLPIYWDDGGDFKIVERSNGKPKTGLWADVLAAMKNGINSATPPVGEEPPITPPGGEPFAGTWNWFSFDDSDNGGTSTITFSETSGICTISGNVTNAYEYGFVGWGANADGDETLAALRTATSISFKVKGDGKTYRISLPTSDITDYCYFESTFTTTNGTEETKTINISTFAQPSWGTQKGSLNKSLLDKIQWQTGEGANGTFSLSIKDLTVQ